MLAGEGMSHRECAIFNFFVLTVHTHDVIFLNFNIAPDSQENIV